MLNHPLVNKRILITGASRGLGAVAAKAFSGQGSRLVLMAKTRNQLEEARGTCQDPEKHLALSVNLLELKDLHAAVEKAIKFLRGIDVVLHAAGGGLGLKDEMLSSQDLLTLFRLNVGAAVEINRLVVPLMKEQQSGNLVHVGSIASSEAVGSVGYNTVKAALSAYVRSLGRELARFDIIATGILPGGFISPGNAMDRFQGTNPAAYQKFVEERLPRRRMGTAEELIPMITLLCSEQASMMGGCLVPIDAGEGRIYL